MTTILTALAVFIFTIVGLVVVLMVARNKLVPSGSVKIFVNDDDANTIETQAGSTLLNLSLIHI